MDTKRTAEATIRTAARPVAQRLANAEQRLLDCLQERGGIDAAQAQVVAAYYRKHKLVRLDAVNGDFTIKHGSLMERDTMLRAIELSQ